MKIIGIDPGLVKTGYGVIELLPAGRMQHVASGLIRPPTDLAMPERLGRLVEGVMALVQQHQPEEAAVEEVFVNLNAKTTLLLGQARGALLAGLYLSKVSAAQYTALQVKKSVVGHGHAEKAQMQAMVGRLLGTAEPLSEDAADALACAICHAHQRQLARVLGVSGFRGGRMR